MSLIYPSYVLFNINLAECRVSCYFGVGRDVQMFNVLFYFFPGLYSTAVVLIAYLFTDVLSQ